jgi:DegV family protein with EDD domain
MTAVHLVCDSTADLDPEFRAAHTVRVVPLKIIFGEETFEDGVDLTAEAFYARLAAPGPFPRTSQPTPAEFEAVFRELGADGGSIVCTTISSELSGTYASATQARTALPDLDIRVVDTRSVSVGHYAAVREAVRVAEAGGDADAVVAAIAAVQATARVLFTVETLEFLRRGGRIGGARALLGSMLDLKPVLEIRGGVIEPVARVRTYPRAIDRVVDDFSRAATEWGGAELIVAHADRPALAATIVERIRSQASDTPSLTVVGPVIGSHSGPGAIGVGFYKPLPK